MEHYKFYSNKECEYFPCHEVKDQNEFNCLFCYCPIYRLGDKCGGNFEYLENGIKSCFYCLIPHSIKGYDYIHNKLMGTFYEDMRLNTERE